MTFDARRTWFGTRFLAIGSREQAARIVRRASYCFILAALVLLALQGLSFMTSGRRRGRPAQEALGGISGIGGLETPVPLDD